MFKRNDYQKCEYAIFFPVLRYRTHLESYPHCGSFLAACPGFNNYSLDGGDQLWSDSDSIFRRTLLGYYV